MRLFINSGVFKRDIAKSAILKDGKETMNNRVRTTLTYLRKNDLIENSGSDTKSSWKKK